MKNHYDLIVKGLSAPGVANNLEVRGPSKIAPMMIRIIVIKNTGSTRNVFRGGIRRILGFRFQGLGLKRSVVKSRRV